MTLPGWVDGRVVGRDGKVLGVEGRVLGVEGRVLGVEGRVLGVEGRVLGRVDGWVDGRDTFELVTGLRLEEPLERLAVDRLGDGRL